MKTRILSFLIMALGLMVSTSAFAQPASGSASGTRVQTSNADLGSTITYAFTSPTTGYTWSIHQVSGSGTTPSNPSDTDNSVTVTWANAVAGDVYDVQAYITDASGCYSEMYAFRVTIVSNPLDFAGANNSQDAIVCSDLNNSTEGGNYTGEETTNGDFITYTLTYAGVDNLERIVFQITDGTNYYNELLVDQGTTPYDIVEDLGSSPVDNSNITISGKDVSFNVNANLYSTSGTLLDVNIISGKTVNGAALTKGTSHPTANLQVQAIPVISFN